MYACMCVCAVSCSPYTSMLPSSSGSTVSAVRFAWILLTHACVCMCVCSFFCRARFWFQSHFFASSTFWKFTVNTWLCLYMHLAVWKCVCVCVWVFRNLKCDAGVIHTYANKLAYLYRYLYILLCRQLSSFICLYSILYHIICSKLCAKGVKLKYAKESSSQMHGYIHTVMYICIYSIYA